MNPNIDKAVSIIMQNYSFFAAPLINQQEFQHWIAESKMQTEVRALSGGLQRALSGEITSYMDALIGKALDTTDTQSLKYGDETRLRALLQRRPQLVNVILKNANNPVIARWNSDHEELTNLFNSLTAISEKAENLRLRGFDTESRIARELANTVFSELNKYIENPSKKNYMAFRNNANSAIESARPALEKHRAIWKPILANLALAILSLPTLGLGYVAAISINKAKTGNWFFFSKTDSCKKIDLLAENLDIVAPKH